MERVQDMTRGAIPMWETAGNLMPFENAMEHRILEVQYMRGLLHTSGHD